MRTKALLLGAVIGAISLANTMAQVYSVNVVGYVNTPIPAGWSIIANPLNASGGNTILNVMPNPPVSITVYKYVNNDYQSSNWDPDWQEWSNPTMDVSPGLGLFVKNGGTNFTWTFVGEVPSTAAQLTVQIAHGFNLIGSPLPKTGKLQTELGYSPSGAGFGDAVYKYDNSISDYRTATWDGDWQEWSPGEPTIEVGAGFWIMRGGADVPWAQQFNVGG